VAKATKLTVAGIAALLLLGAGATVHFTSGPPARRGTAEDAVVSSPAATPSRPRRAAGDEPAAPAAPAEKPVARGLVVGESGTPVAGCRVIVRNHERLFYDEQEAPVRLDSPAAAVTGADGGFVVPRRPDDL